MSCSRNFTSEQYSTFVYASLCTVEQIELATNIELAIVEHLGRGPATKREIALALGARARWFPVLRIGAALWMLKFVELVHAKRLNAEGSQERETEYHISELGFSLLCRMRVQAIKSKPASRESVGIAVSREPDRATGQRR